MRPAWPADTRQAKQATSPSTAVLTPRTTSSPAAFATPPYILLPRTRARGGGGGFVGGCLTQETHTTRPRQTCRRSARRAWGRSSRCPRATRPSGRCLRGAARGTGATAPAVGSRTRGGTACQRSTGVSTLQQQQQTNDDASGAKRRSRSDCPKYDSGGGARHLHGKRNTQINGGSEG